MLKSWMECFEEFSNVSGLKDTLNGRFSDESVKVDDIKSMTYDEIKARAYDYQQTKLLVYKSFDQSGLGKWMTKPCDQNYFKINNL